MKTVRRLYGRVRRMRRDSTGLGRHGEPKHVHVQRDKLLCKFWLEPIHLGKNDGFSPKELNVIRKLIETYLPEILEAWHEHCG